MDVDIPDFSDYFVCNENKVNDLDDKTDEKFSSKNSARFDSFLRSLYSEFSKYQIQRNPRKFNVQNLDDWDTNGKPKGIEITDNNQFQIFLNKIEDYDIDEVDYLRNSTLTEQQLSKLNHVLHLTLKQKVLIRCTSNWVFIFERFISLRGLKRFENIDFLCEHSTLTNFKAIRFYALSTVFIDSDIEYYLPQILERRLPITFIAPKWVVIGENRTINLSGSNLSLYKVNNDKILSDLAEKGHREIDGLPGEPGAPGGIFFGIAEEIVHGKRLTINVSGGPGVSGQNGTDALKILRRDCYSFCDDNGGEELCQKR